MAKNYPQLRRNPRYSGGSLAWQYGLSGELLRADYFAEPTPSGGSVKVWTGIAWAAKPAKVWSGTAWISKPAKTWNGTAWVQTGY
jgi:hypothetical protein